MPAKWQQWMPFRIDAFRSSPAVQAMHPAARIGYLYLLSSAWQTDDCTISSDPLDLADARGLGDGLWAIRRQRILKKFVAVGDSRLRNEVLFEDWCEAKRIFESRQKSAHRTNNSRSPQRHGTVTEQSPSRSADTRTWTRTITETKTETSPLDALDPLTLARSLLEECNIPKAQATEKSVVSAIAAYARETNKPIDAATRDMITAVRGALGNNGLVVNKFWFEDGKYRAWMPNGNKPGINQPSGAQERVSSTVAALRARVDARTGRSSEGTADSNDIADKKSVVHRMNEKVIDGIRFEGTVGERTPRAG